MSESLRDCYGDLEWLEAYLSTKATNHNSYKHYTRFSTAQKIMENGKLLLTDGDRWNDCCDKEQLNSASYDKKYFAACFSFSISESVAMWTLYGGAHSDGAVLSLLPTDMAQIMRAKEVDLCRRAGGHYERIRTLEPSEFDMWLTDVLYTGDNKKGQFTIRRSDERVDLATWVDLARADGLTGIHPYYWKGCPWSYENEVRLVVGVPRELLGTKTNDYALKVGLQKSSSELEKKMVVLQRRETALFCTQSRLGHQMSWNLCRRRMHDSETFS